MSWVVYILKVNMVLIMSWGLYRLAFRQLTFFQWNRFFLLGTVVLSLALPLLQVQIDSHRVAGADFGTIDWTYVDHLVLTPVSVIPSTRGIAPGTLLFILYLLVSIFILAYRIYRFRLLHKLTFGSRRIKKGRVQVFMLDKHIGSFTLFRRIYLDRNAFEYNNGFVLRHEMIHAIQLHSIDRVIMEIVSTILWFNPLVFLLSRYVRENHEFLADEPARNKHGNLVDYLLCLKAEIIRHNSPVLASNFKSSTTIKRIIMLTNTKSKTYKKWRYLVLLPVTLILTIVFQVPVEQTVASPAQLLNLIHLSPDVPVRAEGIPSIFPLPEEHMGAITWGYNQKAIHPFTKKETAHVGVDIKAPKGTSVYATADGEVIKAGSFEGWGLMVVLRHTDGFETVYAHLDDFRVQQGDRVKQSELIGGVGSTGLSTGYHLHYEVRKNGENVDPSVYY